MVNMLAIMVVSSEMERSGTVTHDELLYQISTGCKRSLIRYLIQSHLVIPDRDMPDSLM